MKFLGKIVIPALTPVVINLGAVPSPFPALSSLVIGNGRDTNSVTLEPLADATALAGAVSTSLAAVLGDDATCEVVEGDVVITSYAQITINVTGAGAAELLNLDPAALPLDLSPTMHSRNNQNTSGTTFGLTGFEAVIGFPTTGGTVPYLNVEVGTGSDFASTQVGLPVFDPGQGGAPTPMPLPRGVDDVSIAIANPHKVEAEYVVFGLYRY